MGYIEDVAIDWPDGGEVELNGPRVKLAVSEAWIKVGRVYADCSGYREWVGNWCWDVATVSNEDARRIANYLRDRGWACQSGPTAFYDRWQAAGEIGVDEWRELMEVSDA